MLRTLAFSLIFALKSTAVFSSFLAYVPIDPSTNTTIATVLRGWDPCKLVTHPDETFAYAIDVGNECVSVIDFSTNSVVATVQVGEEPCEIAIAPNGAFAYVTNKSSDTVSVVNTSKHKVIATIPVGIEPTYVTMTPDGTFAYVTNESSDNVTVINTLMHTVIATTPEGSGSILELITPAPLTGLSLSGYCKKNRHRKLFNVINWSLDSDIDPPTHYQIFCDSILIATVPGNITSFEDRNFKRGLYSYLIVAQDQTGALATGSLTIQCN